MELERLNQVADGKTQHYSDEDNSDSEDTETGIKPKDVEERDIWGSRMEFLLAIVGYTVGIGSIWRFPIRCAQNGGGAFLIPFFFFMATCGGPLYYIEVCLGQFSGKSAGKAFEFCPLFKGLGLLMVIISFNVLWYYVTIMGWIQYYFVQSFLPDIPWASCGNWWNTPMCREKVPSTSMVSQNVTDGYQTIVNTTITPLVDNGIGLMADNLTSANLTSANFTSPAQEFWLHNVLRVSSGLEDMGSIQWHLVLSNFVAWALVVASLVKGVKSLGKIVYVTATAPYLLLTVLLVRGLTLDGALDGVMWYITPDFEKLLSSQVWLEAAIQVFYSLGPTYGGVITMASHNKFHQKSVVETTICVASDAFTAFYAGLVVFACMGFMAKESGVSVEEMAKSSGPGLAFVAYPEALSRMPLPQFWAVLFFLMLVTVAFDSTFGMYETVTGALMDIFPKQLARFKYVVLVGMASLLFLLSTPLSMNGGIYLFKLADWYMVAFALLLGSALEGIMVCWIYGADRFAQDIYLMTGRKVSVLLRVFWCIIMTGFLTLGFFWTVSTYTDPNYGDDYVYKRYAIAIGLILSILPMIPIVVCMVMELLHTPGNLIQRISTSLQPSAEWKPFNKRAMEEYKQRPYRYEKTLLGRIKKNILGDKQTPWI